MNTTSRLIGLLDCNNFFVSCERLFRPDLANKPVMVLSSNDGCVVARSQEVKDLRIPMGVPHFQIRDMCDKHSIVSFSSNFTLYRDISARVMSVLRNFTETCEVYSIDEAFFTINIDNDHEILEKLQNLRQTIMHHTGIPVSVGLADTKTLAKVASKVAKSQATGVTFLPYERWLKMSKKWACTEVWGLGGGINGQLGALGIETASEFMSLSEVAVRSRWGVYGSRVRQELLGKQVYGVKLPTADVRASLTSSRSLAVPTERLSDVERFVFYHVSVCARKLRQEKLQARGVRLSFLVKAYGQKRRSIGREAVMIEATDSTNVLLRVVGRLLRELWREGLWCRKVEVSVFDISPLSTRSLSLFEDKVKTENTTTLEKLMDAMEDKFGSQVLTYARLINTEAGARSGQKSPAYTTRWSDIPTVKTG